MRKIIAEVYSVISNVQIFLSPPPSNACGRNSKNNTAKMQAFVIHRISIYLFLWNHLK
jgi:hypothetical protein